jgi:hypothetical protein
MENLWSDKIGKISIIPPIAILKEQASFLGKMTKNIVEAQIGTNQEGENFLHVFTLVANALGPYRYHLFKVRHPLTLYPLRILFMGSWFEVKDQEAFEQKLKEIFNSDETIKIINSILAQSQ